MCIYIYTHSVSQVLKATCGQRLRCWPGRPWTSTILSKMNRTIALNFESLWDDLVRRCVEGAECTAWPRLIFKCGLLIANKSHCALWYKMAVILLGDSLCPFLLEKKITILGSRGLSKHHPASPRPRTQVRGVASKHGVGGMRHSPQPRWDRGSVSTATFPEHVLICRWSERAPCSL